MKPATILAALLLATVSSVAQAQLFRSARCNCQMCRALRGEIPGYTWSNGRLVAKQRAAARPVQRPTAPAKATAPASPAAPDTTLVPSPPAVVAAVLDLANIREGDVYADLGCGDGRYLIAALERGAHFAIGIEIDRQTAELARRNVADKPGAFIVEADVREVSLTRYDVMTMYLFPESMPPLDSMKPGATILSISHPIPGVEARRVLIQADGKQHPVYVYRKPVEAR